MVSVFTLKTRYALRALIDLATQSRTADDQQLCPAREIAERTAIPPKYLEVILGELAAAGYIVSRKGKYGGHRLLRPISAVSVWDVVCIADPAWQEVSVRPEVEVEAATVAVLHAQIAAILRRVTLDQVLSNHQAAARNLHYAI